MFGSDFKRFDKKEESKEIKEKEIKSNVVIEEDIEEELPDIEEEEPEEESIDETEEDLTLEEPKSTKIKHKSLLKVMIYTSNEFYLSKFLKIFKLDDGFNINNIPSVGIGVIPINTTFEDNSITLALNLIDPRKDISAVEESYSSGSNVVLIYFNSSDPLYGSKITSLIERVKSFSIDSKMVLIVDKINNIQAEEYVNSILENNTVDELYKIENEEDVDTDSFWKLVGKLGLKLK